MVVGDYSGSRPGPGVADVSGELGLNAVMGPGRYGDDVPIVATTGLGQVVRRAQAAREGVSLGAAGRPVPVEHGLTNQILPSELARLRAQQIIKERGGLPAAPSMAGMEWQPREIASVAPANGGPDAVTGEWGQRYASPASASRVDPSTAAPARPLTQEELAAAGPDILARDRADRARARAEMLARRL